MNESRCLNESGNANLRSSVEGNSLRFYGKAGCNEFEGFEQHLRLLSASFLDQKFNQTKRLA
jgi:hypothetical protein